MYAPHVWCRNDDVRAHDQQQRGSANRRSSLCSWQYEMLRSFSRGPREPPVPFASSGFRSTPTLRLSVATSLFFNALAIRSAVITWGSSCPALSGSRRSQPLSHWVLVAVCVGASVGFLSVGVGSAAGVRVGLLSPSPRFTVFSATRRLCTASAASYAESAADCAASTVSSAWVSSNRPSAWHVHDGLGFPSQHATLPAAQPQTPSWYEQQPC